MGDAKKKRKGWIWALVVGGVVFFVLVGLAAVVLFPSTPYGFLRGARLQDIEIEDSTYAAAMSVFTGSGPVPDHVTYRRYALAGNDKELVRRVKDELTAAKGWVVLTEYEDQAIQLVRGNEWVWVAGPNVDPSNMGNNTVITVMPTTFMDKVLDKTHRDERPKVEHWP